MIKNEINERDKQPNANAMSDGTDLVRGQRHRPAGKI